MQAIGVHVDAFLGSLAVLEVFVSSQSLLLLFSAFSRSCFPGYVILFQTKSISLIQFDE